jgi:transcriptional regulator GlxA family with amidase domain
MIRIALALGDDLLLASVAPLLDVVGLIRSYMAGIEQRTGERWAPVQLCAVNASGKDEELFGGYVLPAAASFDGDALFDAIYLPASARMHVRNLGAHARKNRRLIEWVARQHAGGALVAAIGDGIFPVADAGLLTRGCATTSKLLAPLFHKRYPDVELDLEVAVAEHERVLTSGPIGCELQLITRLVQRVISPTVAEFIGEITELDSPRRVLHFPATPAAIHDPIVARARRWLRENSLRRITAADLVAALDVQPRTLTRHFQKSLGLSPHEFIQGLKVEASKRLLLRTDFTVERIAARVGYSNTNHFRSVFRKHVGVLPGEYRDSHRG